MILHLGGDFSINVKDVIAILDIKSTLKSKDSKTFFKICKEEGFIRRISEEEPRSLVFVERKERKNNKKNKTIVYESPISALTLQKRAKLNNSPPFS